MPRLGPLAWRLPIALCGVGAVAAGLVFVAAAEPGEGSAGPSAPGAAVSEASPGPSLAPSPAFSATVPSATPAESETPSPEPTATATAETPAADSASATPVAVATAQRARPTDSPAPEPTQATPPAPTPAPTDAPGPITDLPAYRDTVVLGLAASAILPGGHTFRQCIDSSPGPEHWPLAVHLYYLGGGEWVVETHLSEVAVVFTEATATFRVSSYHPVGPDC